MKKTMSNRERFNSVLLLLYMLVAFLYYYAGDALRIPLFGIVLGFSILAVIETRKNKGNYRFGQKLIRLFSFFFFTGAFIQLSNGTITPFILYLVAAPCLVYFIYNNSFNLKIVSYSVYIISVVFLIYFLLHGRMEGVFPYVSVNYISVVLIMNAVLINFLEYKQDRNVSFLPSILALFFSLLAFGRSGILCAFLLVLNVVWFRWKSFSVKKKIGVGFLITLPLMGYVLLNFNVVVNIFDGLTVLERFQERGLESPARDILMREYLAHIDLKTFLLGYNYDKNTWFIHYGLNPHNSYIRLHHFLGALFFIVVPALIIALIRLLRFNKFLFMMLFSILLRAYTDTMLFLYLYDFLVVLLVMMAFNIKRENKRLVLNKIRN